MSIVKNPFPLTVAAPSTFDIEAEPAGVVIPDLGLMRRRESPADLVKCLQMSRRIGSGGPRQRRLVEKHDLGDVTDHDQFVMRSRIHGPGRSNRSRRAG